MTDTTPAAPATKFTKEEVEALFTIINERMPIQNMKEAAALSQSMARLRTFVIEHQPAPPSPPDSAPPSTP